MKHLNRFILAGLFVFACATISHAQDAAPGAGFTEEPATVYIYRTQQAKTPGRAAPAVFVDGKMLARLDGGRYLVADLDEGTHTFSTNKKEGGVEVNLMGGNTYYISLATDSGVNVGSPRLKVVPNEEGASAVKQLKPVKGGGGRRTGGK